MNEQDIKIVRVRNIFDFDFTGELGARYGGRDFVIPAGKSLLAPQSIGRHLAVHLARQSLIRNAPVRDGSETDGKGSERPLWNEEQLEELVGRIVTDEFEEEKPAAVNEADRILARVEALNETFPVTPEVGEPPVGTGKPPVLDGRVYADKAEVIAELEKRNIKFNARLSKANLEKLLTE